MSGVRVRRSAVALCSPWLGKFHPMASDSKLPPAPFVLAKILVQDLGQVLSAGDTGEQMRRRGA